jgi:hypothetical protein
MEWCFHPDIDGPRPGCRGAIFTRGIEKSLAIAPLARVELSHAQRHHVVPVVSMRVDELGFARHVNIAAPHPTRTIQALVAALWTCGKAVGARDMTENPQYVLRPTRTEPKTISTKEERTCGTHSTRLTRSSRTASGECPNHEQGCHIIPTAKVAAENL